jgi:AraC-like DNA-binding protein
MMKKLLKKADRMQTELRVCDYGIEQCLPDHAFGPAVREYYLIHFIISGHGIFQSNNQMHVLAPGQGFLICPEQITYYQADAVDPWYYIWLGFQGSKAEELLHQCGFSADNPIIVLNSTVYGKIEAYLRSVTEIFSWKKARDLHLLGILYLILAELQEFSPVQLTAAGQPGRAENYARQAIELMQMNYSRKISICDLSRQIGLERSYFGALFQHQTGTSPQQYLLHLRMEKACALLTLNELPIAAVAHSVGYSDPLLFSRMFSKVIGCSPSAYRRDLTVSP